ncbi:dockerin type I domain-containing protein [Marinagarivorans cellulosilyticus]|uniref:Dockerin domain-containing protein n=1 Tax=Marinagarivorans cellulosilyticus TaxID=2721545 RepID=A0AAN1WEQ9_9GAMM|nr:dockerin type I domain-containing protein [Marinagarivorans cellulosilyticus]BCD96231.1 hypothetical protein MARGE09_P0430 [Marinagarivorans cellulosilyticus]
MPFQRLNFTKSTLSRIAFAAFSLTLSVASSAALLATERVNISNTGAQANSSSYKASISANGNHIAFFSNASNLVADDFNAFGDIFVRDLTTGVTERVNVDSAGNEAMGHSEFGDISADGRYVVFSSHADNLVPGDTNGWDDVFIRDRELGTTERLSVSTSGAQTNWWSQEPSISGDGRYVVFTSHDSQLSPNDTNNTHDVFLRDRQAGTTTLISVSTTGTLANGGSYMPTISDNGTHITYVSSASNLVANDTNGWEDIFVYEIATGTTTRVSLDIAGAQIQGNSRDPNISANGRYVVFLSNNSEFDPFIFDESEILLHDTQTSTTEKITISHDGSATSGMNSRPSISADGRYVSFSSNISNLISDDTNFFEDIFVFDRNTSTTERISLDINGNEINDGSYGPTISSNALYVVYESNSPNIVANDTNGFSDIFVARLDNIEAGGQRIKLSPSHATVDPIADPQFSVDIQVSASDLYGLEVNCFADSTLATLDGASYGDLFDPNSRLEIPMLINNPALGDWRGSLSLMNPALPINGSGVFATLDYSALEVNSTTLDITCVSSAADINGQAIILDMENASISIDDGIHTPNGATITGKIALPNGADPSGVEVSIKLGERTVSTLADANGDFTFTDLKNGVWVVSYKHPQYVNSCSITQTQNGDTTVMDDETMIAGDINGDGVIDIADFTVISATYGSNSSDTEYAVAADLNGDNVINIFDLTILGSHFGINSCDPSAIVPQIDPSVTFTTTSPSPEGTTSLNATADELTWQRDAAFPGASTTAFAYAKPADVDQFAIGLQLSGMQTSYMLVLRNPDNGNSIHVYYDAETPTPNLFIDSFIDGLPQHDSFLVPLLMDQLEIGYDHGNLTVNLGSLSHTAMPLPAGLGDSPSNWEIEVTLMHSSLTPTSGTSSVKLITDAFNGLALPTSPW